MPHDEASSHWHEPKAGQKAGLGKFGRPAMPYDTFMEAEGVPIYRDIGCKTRARTADEALGAAWRQGHLHPALRHRRPVGHVCRRGAGRRRAQRREAHVREDRASSWKGAAPPKCGTTASPTKQTFEWQRGSMFPIPLNANHRFVNATNSPALILCGTSAPNVMNLFDNPHFIFNNPYNFTDRYAGTADYFKDKDDIAPDPVRGLAMRKTNFIPDVDQLRSAARQPPLARLPPRRAAHGRQPLLSMGRPARDGPLFQGAQARLAPRCSSASRARATPIRGRKFSACSRGRTARASK